MRNSHNVTIQMNITTHYIHLYTHLTLNTNLTAMRVCSSFLTASPGAATSAAVSNMAFGKS